VRPASEWAEEHVRSRQKGCHDMATWIAAIQADAYAQAIEDAARYVDKYRLPALAQNIRALRVSTNGGGE
jgi:hypothetical protein